MTARFECPICGETFEQRSRLKRHRTTSHPPQAPSAADIEHALKGIELPRSRDALVEHAEGRADDAVVDVLRELPDRTYRDAAEVARALGEIRRDQEKSAHQPSRLGGEEALDSDSAAALAEIFHGAAFPLSDQEVKERVRERGSDALMERVRGFASGPYDDMSEIMQELGRQDG